jgi:putative FmdB family regulatory protein
MPLYEYRCHECGTVFEVMQKFSDQPLETHAGCGGKVERLISPSVLHFKGTGWYVTDYARGNGSSGSGPSKTDAGQKADAGAKKEPAAAKPAPAGDKK